jgi:hypothetical protein
MEATAEPLDAFVAAGLEREHKLLLPAGRSAAVRALLDASCGPDPLYPVNRVITIYFDTPDLRALGDKLSGASRKAKLRLRWYRGENGETTEPVVEIKQRYAAWRCKLRAAAPGLPTAALARLPLHHPAVGALPRLVEALGRTLPPDLRPVLTVSYARRRYREPLSGARVSLDTDLRVDAVHPGLGLHPPLGALPECVLEIKTPRAEIPERLRPALGLGCRPGSFSKYAACWRPAPEAGEWA